LVRLRSWSCITEAFEYRQIKGKRCSFSGTDHTLFNRLLSWRQGTQRNNPRHCLITLLAVCEHSQGPLEHPLARWISPTHMSEAALQSSNECDAWKGPNITTTVASLTTLNSYSFHSVFSYCHKLLTIQDSMKLRASCL